MFDGVHKNRGEPTFKTFIGQVSRQSRSMGPTVLGKIMGSVPEGILMWVR